MSNKQSQIYIHTYIHTYIHIYIHTQGDYERSFFSTIGEQSIIKLVSSIGEQSIIKLVSSIGEQSIIKLVSSIGEQSIIKLVSSIGEQSIIKSVSILCFFFWTRTDNHQTILTQLCFFFRRRTLLKANLNFFTTTVAERWYPHCSFKPRCWSLLRDRTGYPDPR